MCGSQNSRRNIERGGSRFRQHFRVRLETKSSDPIEIVGIVRDAKYASRRPRRVRRRPSSCVSGGMRQRKKSGVGIGGFGGTLLRAVEALAATAASIRHQPHDPHQTVEKALWHGAANVHPTAHRTAWALFALAVSRGAFHAILSMPENAPAV